MNNRLALLKDQIEKRLDMVKDPISGLGLVSAGRITGLNVHDDGKVSFTIEAPSEAASAFAIAREQSENAARSVDGVSAVLAVLTSHSSSVATPGIGRVKSIIAVASAKGGVGKSTFAVNLACAFAAMGLKAGFLDLDVYGPSAPTLLGCLGTKPLKGPGKSLLPVDTHGLRTMSIGYLVDPDSPMIWRGAMATSAVRQMIEEVMWGELDVLLLDLPPGTGDVQLTLVQRVPLAGAIIVSTPQEMALADVRRGMAMFDKTHAPILGVIENMAYYETPTGERVHIFGEGGARRTAEQAGAPFLGELPIDVSLRQSADAGAPLVAKQPEHSVSRRFRAMAEAAYANIARFAKPAPSIRLS